MRNRNSMASRGSVLVPKLPDLGYTVNRKRVRRVWRALGFNVRRRKHRKIRTGEPRMLAPTGSGRA